MASEEETQQDTGVWFRKAASDLLKIAENLEREGEVEVAEEIRRSVAIGQAKTLEKGVFPGKTAPTLEATESGSATDLAGALVFSTLIVAGAILLSVILVTGANWFFPAMLFVLAAYLVWQHYF